MSNWASDVRVNFGHWEDGLISTSADYRDYLPKEPIVDEMQYMAYMALHTDRQSANRSKRLLAALWKRARRPQDHESRWNAYLSPHPNTTCAC